MERDGALAADELIIPLDSNTELRTIRAEDAGDLYAAIDRNREHLRRWLPWIVPAYSVEDSRRFVAESVAGFAAHESLTLTIRHKEALCGAIGLHRIDHRNRTTSIGYWIDAAHQGKGIVTKACRAVVTEGFRRFGLHRIEIRCATWNHRSSAVPRRLGFAEEGILRESEWVHDKWVDLRVFSILAQEWPG